MTYNQNNEKYKSAFQGIPFEAKQLGGATAASRNGRRMESHNVKLRPVFRNPPDLARIGRALIEMAMNESSDQKPAKK